MNQLQATASLMLSLWSFLFFLFLFLFSRSNQVPFTYIHCCSFSPTPYFFFTFLFTAKIHTHFIPCCFEWSLARWTLPLSLSVYISNLWALCLLSPTLQDLFLCVCVSTYIQGLSTHMWIYIFFGVETFNNKIRYYLHWSFYFSLYFASLLCNHYFTLFKRKRKKIFRLKSFQFHDFLREFLFFFTFLKCLCF